MKSLSSFAAGALLLGSACSKHSEVRSPPARTGASYEAPPDESIWGKAFDAIADGTATVADADEWTLEKAKDGAIVVWRETRRVAGRVGEEVSDASVHSAIKTRFAGAEGLDASNIGVDVDEGVVTLRGTVGTQQEAANAIWIALDTRGVDQVVSYLTWP